MVTRIAVVAGVVVLSVVLARPQNASAQAGGPDHFRVTGLEPGTTLAVRSGPGPDFPQIGSLASDADGIRNLGCRGGLSFAEWELATTAEREAGRKTRWCQIEHGGLRGWAAGWLLAEGSGPAAAAPAGELRAKPLLAKRWELVASPAGPATGKAWLTFAADGHVTGNAGCNNLTGSAEIGDRTIRFKPLAATRKFCAGPAGTQEAVVLAVLAGEVAYELRDGGLVLHAKDGGRLEFAAPNG